MTQVNKSFATKSDGLSSVTGTYREEENPLLKIALLLKQTESQIHTFNFRKLKNNM